MDSVVISDSCVFLKLFHTEEDSFEAKEFFEMCVKNDTKLIVPDLFVYEIIDVTRKKGYKVIDIIEIFELYKDVILEVLLPEKGTFLLAEKISTDGHKKSSFPNIYDSIYHALAIRLNGFFVTADRKHYSKSKKYGHIILLEDWKSIFLA